MSDTPVPPPPHPNTPPFPPPGTVPPPQPPVHPATPPPQPYQPTGPIGHPSAPPSADGTEIRPRKRWLWVSGAVVVLGVVAAVLVAVLGFAGIADRVDDFDRVERGTGSIQIDDPGEYVVYSEEGTASVRLAIIGPDGEPVPTSRYTNELTYDFGGRSGVAAITFDAPSAGIYAVQTDTDIAVGSSIASALIRTILFPFVIGGLSVTVGIVMAIVVLVRRSTSKQRLGIT